MTPPRVGGVVQRVAVGGGSVPAGLRAARRPDRGRAGRPADGAGRARPWPADVAGAYRCATTRLGSPRVRRLDQHARVRRRSLPVGTDAVPRDRRRGPRRTTGPTRGPTAGLARGRRRSCGTCGPDPPSTSANGWASVGGGQDAPRARARGRRERCPGRPATAGEGGRRACGAGRRRPAAGSGAAAGAAGAGTACGFRCPRRAPPRGAPRRPRRTRRPTRARSRSSTACGRRSAAVPRPARRPRRRSATGRRSRGAAPTGRPGRGRSAGRRRRRRAPGRAPRAAPSVVRPPRTSGRGAGARRRRRIGHVDARGAEVRPCPVQVRRPRREVSGRMPGAMSTAPDAEEGQRRARIGPCGRDRPL